MEYATGWFGIPGSKGSGGRVHIVRDGKPLCGERPHHCAVFQCNANGIAMDMVECRRCKERGKVITTPPVITERWRRVRQASQTISLSERDVARVLMAVSKLEEWKEFATHPSIQNQPPKKDFLSFWIRTPEGWPVPSRKLMEEIKKLLF